MKSRELIKLIKKWIQYFLAAAAILGAVFVGIRSYEYVAIDVSLPVTYGGAAVFAFGGCLTAFREIKKRRRLAAAEEKERIDAIKAIEQTREDVNAVLVITRELRTRSVSPPPPRVEEGSARGRSSLVEASEKDRLVHHSAPPRRSRRWSLEPVVLDTHRNRARSKSPGDPEHKHLGQMEDVRISISPRILLQENSDLEQSPLLFDEGNIRLEQIKEGVSPSDSKSLNDKEAATGESTSSIVMIMLSPSEEAASEPVANELPGRTFRSRVRDASPDSGSAFRDPSPNAPERRRNSESDKNKLREKRNSPDLSLVSAPQTPPSGEVSPVILDRFLDPPLSAPSARGYTRVAPGFTYHIGDKPSVGAVNVRRQPSEAKVSARAVVPDTVNPFPLVRSKTL